MFQEESSGSNHRCTRLTTILDPPFSFCLPPVVRAKCLSELKGWVNTMRSLRIYDIDGTITTPGHDLWYLTTRSLVVNPIVFDQSVELWKQALKAGACPYESSQSMMQKGIECIDESCDEHCVKQRAGDLSKYIIQNQHYYLSAIRHIQASIDAGFLIVFSTTNYHEGAEAFLEQLVEHQLIRDSDRDKIICSGSVIDWKSRSIVHFNMGHDKTVGISNALQIPIDELPSYVDSAYGDDPLGNDAGILSLSEKSFVIANPKNSEVYLPKNLIRTSWEDILKNYF